MARPVTVRLFPLLTEHNQPVVVDIGAFVVFCAVWLSLDRRVGEVVVVYALAFAVLVHAAQMFWLVALRFDDDAITIIRPWQRRRIEWSSIAGLIYSSPPTRRRLYRLHVVLKGAEPPFGRYLGDTELMRYAKGPVVMTLVELKTEFDSNTPADRCRSRVLTELARHGFPPPAPFRLRYRSPDFTPQEWDRAVAEDFIRIRDEHGTGGRIAPD